MRKNVVHPWCTVGCLLLTNSINSGVGSGVDGGGGFRRFDEVGPVDGDLGDGDVDLTSEDVEQLEERFIIDVVDEK